MNLWPLTWWTRRLMAPRRRFRNGCSLLLGRRHGTSFGWSLSKTFLSIKSDVFLIVAEITHLETIVDQFSHAIFQTAPSPPRSLPAVAACALSNRQTLLWCWHWRHHRLVLYGTRWCPMCWHFPLREWILHSRLDRMFSAWCWIDLQEKRKQKIRFTVVDDAMMLSCARCVNFMFN